MSVRFAAVAVVVSLVALAVGLVALVAEYDLD